MRGGGGGGAETEKEQSERGEGWRTGGRVRDRQTVRY